MFHGCLRRDSNPRPRSRKEENPIKTRGRYDLPLTKAWTGGLSITASRSAGLACLPLLVYARSDESGRSVPDMPFGQDGVTQPKELGESKADMKRVQTVCLRFEPSNPLTILRCTFDFVKSNRAAAPADARPKACTMAVPYRSHRPAEACHAYAMSESYSHCTGTRIHAAAQHTPPP